MKSSSKQSLSYRESIFPLSLPLLVSIYLILAICFSVVACRQSSPTLKSSRTSTKENHKFVTTEIKHAKGFNIKYFSRYKLLQIFNKSGRKTDTLNYSLIPSGNSAPKGFQRWQIIEIPVKSLIGMSSLQIAMADFAESPNVLTGLASSKYVSSPKVRANIKAGRVVEVGEEGTINSEVIIATKPDLVMAMGNPTASFSKYQNLLNAGIPVVLVSEWLEHSPLGRAEWVKLMAALVNKEALVNTKFARIEKEYARLAKIGRSSLRKPSIIVGMPYKGSWFVPDGTSYMTQFFKDAGASYNWYDTKGTGSMGLNFESVAPVALKADYWINFGIANTKTDISTLDERYTYFKPFKNNTIYNFNKRVNDIGSNDYWESGVVNPHLVLSDLIKILHPEALPKHELIYYKQIL
ncbi:MAG TPA: ABC transporter substrate-binding protein [Pedobacter sp.]|jgi:iron complex transport system substrate-binding protein